LSFTNELSKALKKRLIETFTSNFDLLEPVAESLPGRSFSLFDLWFVQVADH